MMTTAFNTKTVNGLMEMFYDGACKRNLVQKFDYVDNPHFDIQFTLTAKQFTWLCDVERREMNDLVAPRGRNGRQVTGQIEGLGFFTAQERRYGSAVVNVRFMSRYEK